MPGNVHENFIIVSLIWIHPQSLGQMLSGKSQDWVKITTLATALRIFKKFRPSLYRSLFISMK
jgi:hypothetical protein